MLRIFVSAWKICHKTAAATKRKRSAQRERGTMKKGQRRTADENWRRQRRRQETQAKRNCSKLAQIFDGAAPFEQVQVFMSAFAAAFAPDTLRRQQHYHHHHYDHHHQPELKTGDHTTTTFVPRRFCWFAPFGIVFCAQSFSSLLLFFFACRRS